MERVGNGNSYKLSFKQKKITHVTPAIALSESKSERICYFRSGEKSNGGKALVHCVVKKVT